MVASLDLHRSTDAVVPDGWTIREGFDLPPTPWDLGKRQWVCRGEVADHDRAAAAISALVRGVGLVIAVGLVGDDRRRFEEDLARTGTVVVDVDPASGLGVEHIELLEGLAAGLSVTAAAAQAHVSRRTANRRLAEVRARLGVGSTAEAVTCWSARRTRSAQEPR